MLFPAKTFLLGEYCALIGGDALILTTKPCFSLEIKDSHQSLLEGINMLSPAGKLWHKYGPKMHAIWHDPYKSIGGFGASGAEFLAVYKALGLPFNIRSILENYFSFLTGNNKPSAYDLIAQMHEKVVYINKKDDVYLSLDWGFKDFSFIIVHTGKKIITHENLDIKHLLDKFIDLNNLANLGYKALVNEDKNLLCEIVKNYYLWLLKHKLVATHTIEIIQKLNKIPEVLACKGCGAMGADTIVILCNLEHKSYIKNILKTLELMVYADEISLYKL